MRADAVNWLKGELQPVLVPIRVSETYPAPLVPHSEKTPKYWSSDISKASAIFSFLSNSILFHLIDIKIEVAINVFFWEYLELMTQSFEPQGIAVLWHWAGWSPFIFQQQSEKEELWEFIAGLAHVWCERNKSMQGLSALSNEHLAMELRWYP